MDELNPYAAPKAELLNENANAEVIRQAHISTEASIKSIGCLYYIGTLGLLVAVITTGSTVFHSSGTAKTDYLMLMGLIVGLILTASLGYGLRRLRFWAAVIAAVISAASVLFGLLSLPQSIIGILIQVLIISTVIGKKGRRVLASDYQQIIAETPHVKHRTATWLWVLLAVLVIILIIGAVAAMKSNG